MLHLASQPVTCKIHTPVYPAKACPVVHTDPTTWVRIYGCLTCHLAVGQSDRSSALLIALLQQLYDFASCCACCLFVGLSIILALAPTSFSSLVSYQAIVVSASRVLSSREDFQPSHTRVDPRVHTLRSLVFRRQPLDSRPTTGVVSFLDFLVHAYPLCETQHVVRNL